ncbi:MAG: hypothetical protein A3H96_01015 [Acidobacteria bacterium RIFCSPLOWO2_02_FULL_67_36]|nr:MAG: hypothetical protein A3H96_01015 [Acidobacteria bacterium RIFCSPLOWO2_02_FULL_67_36]
MRATLRLFLDHLEANDVIRAAPPSNPTPIAQLKARYEAHLQHDRGLSPVTGPRHWFLLGRFLHERFGDGPIDLRVLTADDVTRSVLAQIPTRSPASAQLHASTLRSFLRFLWQAGEIPCDLAAAIPPVRRWRLVDVPKYLTPADVTRLLNARPRAAAARHPNRASRVRAHSLAMWRRGAGYRRAHPLRREGPEATVHAAPA